MKMPRCTAACSQYNDQPGVSGLFAGVLSEIPPGYFREQRERAEAEPNQGGISFSAGVLSEKPPDISADDQSIITAGSCAESDESDESAEIIEITEIPFLYPQPRGPPCTVSPEGRRQTCRRHRF